MTDNCKEIISFLNCEYELFENEADDQRVIDRFNALTEQGKLEGFVPLIIVVSDTLAEATEFVFDDYDDVENSPKGIAEFRQKVIAESASINAEEYLKGLSAERDSIEPMMGDFPEEEADMPKGFFISLMNYKGEMESEIILAKIPTANPWELAVWMPMGGFNDCPKPAEQMAVFRYWYEKYGAIPALVSYDIWEMELSKPPVTNEECEQLACEQYAFCYDIVDQGVGSIRALASELRHATTWYFWWD